MGYNLIVAPTIVSANTPFEVSWVAPPGRPERDWVGLYRVGDPPGAYITWIYTRGTTVGAGIFTAPLTPGQYEFRYMLDDGFVEAGKSNPVLVI